MIRADFRREGESLRLIMEGHAEQGEAGRDIVCAAASGIFYALAGYLSNFRRESARIGKIRSGSAEVSCGADGEEAMRLTYIGLLQLALTYPENICVTDGIWRHKVASPRDIAAEGA